MTQNHRGSRFPVEVLTREEADTLLRVTSKRFCYGLQVWVRDGIILPSERAAYRAGLVHRASRFRAS